ncbi:glycosyltransferase family 2 protein [Chlamydiota bacterium]
MFNTCKVSVIIPAFNEETSIDEVLQAIPQFVDKIIVVDNGSTDKTAHVAKKNGATVVSEPIKGYGRACLKGISMLDGNGADIVVFLDADFSDYPEEMDRLIEPIAKDEVDFVLGSRILGRREKKALVAQAYWGNRLAVFLIQLFFGFVYTDMGPFRAISYNSLQRLGMKDVNFGWNAEMQIKALLHSLRIREVPVDYRKRVGKSKISGTISGTVKAGCKIIYIILKYIIIRKK